MEALVFILIIVFFVLSEKKKGKGGASSKAATQKHATVQKQTAARMRAVAQKQAAAPKRAVELSPEERESVRQALLAKRAERQAAVAVQGDSHEDGEGCVGGSMAHDHTEGESQSEHARHIAAMEARDAEEAAAAEPRGLAGLDLRDMRRAVVISEILGKPKALQKRA